MGLTVEDRLEIAELYARYNHAVDSGDAPGWVATFTDDGMFDGGPAGTASGSAELAELAARITSGPRTNRHWINNLVLSGGGDGATGQAYLALVAVSGESGPHIATTGMYADELARTASGWRFSKRTFTRDG